MDFLSISDSKNRRLADLSPVFHLRSISAKLTMPLLLSLCAMLLCSVWAQAQVQVVTSRGNNARWGSNTSETILTPSNVNSSSFGHLFSVPIDYQSMAQPLYMPQVTIPGQGVHNVVYVVTLADSAYAFDADNGSLLWHVDLTMGGVPASGSDLPCGLQNGFYQEGIASTPVIDPTTNTMYVVAKTLINGTVTDYLHALDITTGLDKASMGSPMLIAAKSVSKKGRVKQFSSKLQKNRPGLLLLNGVVYLGFGSNGCNGNNTGWVLAYNAANVQQQVGAFNTSPDNGLVSIWQTGNGLAADEAGNVFVSTAEGHKVYDVPDGGQGYANSVLKLTPPPWSPQNQTGANPQPADFFTPWDVVYLNANDLDISSVGPMVLPDQPGLYPHEVIASGKQALVYVLNRDDMGQYSAGGADNVIQEYQLEVGGLLMCSPAYWNGIVYFASGSAPVQTFQLSNGSLIPFAQTTPRLAFGAHSPSISANGNTNGILWVLDGILYAFDAVSLRELYSSSQVPSRDTLPPIAHFATQTVANGKVYIATQTSLEVYGLQPYLSIAAGNNQTTPVLGTLATPLQIQAYSPSGQPQPGITVNFNDGNKGGTFNPPSAPTNSSGIASTTYTFPKTSGVYSLTATVANYSSVTATETAAPLAAVKLVYSRGAKQTGAAGTVLPNPAIFQARDKYGNPVPGLTVNFTATQNGVPTPNQTVTNANGWAITSIQLPTTVTTVRVSAGTAGLPKAALAEYSVAGPAASINVTAGNNQSGQPGTTLSQTLSVSVTDQYGNPVPGAMVSFSDGGAGGHFSNPNPQSTPGSGSVAQNYTLPASAGTITITAAVGGVTNAATFIETSQ
jgi:outer membrane protein assembly factor BamB